MANVAPTYLVDTSGQQWQLAATNDGRYSTNKVSGQVAVAAILLADTQITKVYRVTIVPSPPPPGQAAGDVIATPTSSSSSQTQILVNSPDGNLWAIQYANQYIEVLPFTCVVTFLQMAIDLSNRLADPNMVFWTLAELKLYIIEALRTWNALTEIWNAVCVFTAQSPQVWYDLTSLPGSPRLRTVLDTDIYTIMQYHLLEPPSGGTWTGTSQFSITDLQGALQRRRDEMIQLTGCNLGLYTFPSTPNTRNTQLPNTVLEPIRARFVPAVGSPTTMMREDMMAFDGFEPNHLQQTQTPQAWDLITEPPLSMAVDTAPGVAGQYDAIAIQSGPIFFPPTGTLLGVPNDWSWLAKWGALADLWSRDSEATDRERADYCFKRYQDGLKIMQMSNWLVNGRIANVPVDTPSLRETDGFSPEWQNDPNAWPGLVQAGIDLVAPCPVANGTPIGVSMTLVGNAPVPVNDGDCVQVLRDTYDTILDYAQCLAALKMGGAEWKATLELEKKFFSAAKDNNKRLTNLALFSDLIHDEGKREQIAQPRYE